MNKIFKVIWSKARNCYVVVSELAKSHDDGHVRRSRSGVCRKAAVLAAWVLTMGVSGAALAKENVNVVVDDNINLVVEGKQKTANGKNNIIYGTQNTTDASNTVFIGNDNNIKGEYNIVIGQSSGGESVQNAIVIGHDTKADGSGAIVIGNGAKTESQAGGYTENNIYHAAGLSLGEYSFNRRKAGQNGYLYDKDRIPYEASKYASGYWDAAWTATANPLSIGDVDQGANDNGGAGGTHGMITRQITGVAAGSSLTDAVNVAQLRAVNDRIDKINVTASGVHYYSVKSTSETDEKQNTNYYNEGASAKNALAAGVNAKASGENAVAIGYNAKAEGTGATVIGQYASATGDYATAFGGKQTDTSAIAANNMAGGDNAVAFGERTTASGDNATAFGWQTQATEKRATAFGQRTQAIQSNATAFGIDTIASGQNATAFGNLTQATKIGATAFGNKNQATGQYATAWGGGDKVIGKDSSGNDIKQGTVASGTYATAFGERTTASGESATAFGSDSTASGTNATTWGESSSASGEASTAFGIGSQAEGKNSLAALGGLAANENSIAIGQGTKANNADKVVSAAIGQNAEASGERSLAIGFGVSEKVNDKDDTTLTKTEASGESAIAIGTDVAAKGQHSLAMGSHTDAAKDSSVAIGFDAHTVSDSAVAIGSGTKAAGLYSVALGLSSVAGTETNNTKNPLEGGGSVAIGWGTSAEASRSVAIGTGATAADAEFTMALGDLANAQQRGSVAIGAGSVATRAAGNKEGGTEYKEAYLIPDVSQASDDEKAIWTSTEGAVSVGGTAKYKEYENGKQVQKTKLLTRQITHVAAGSDDTDAVNVAQLKKLNEALVDQGLTFTGNNEATLVKRQLGETLKVQGDGNKADSEYSGQNVKVVGNSTDGSLKIMLDQNSVFDSVTTGDSKIDTNGLTITNGPTITKTNVSMNNQQIHDVVAGTADTDAVNVSQLNSKIQNVESHHTDVTVNGGNAAPVDGNYTTEGNLRLKVTTDEKTGKKTFDVKLADDLNINSVTTEDEAGNTTVQNGSGITTTDKDGNTSEFTANGVKTTDTSGNTSNLTSTDLTFSDNTEGGNTTTVSKDGVNINNGDVTLNDAGLTIKDGPSVTKDGINAGNKQITNVASGINGKAYDTTVEGQENWNNAANIGDIQTITKAATDVVEQHHTAVTVNGGTGAPDAGADGQYGSYTGGNLQLAQKNEDGKITYDLKLADNLNIGGKNGEDGVDGHIGINGADGKSGVGIDGKDGISIKGADGKDGVTIKGVVGKDGTEGHIGLTGAKGADGKNAAADIHVKNGQNGVDGTDGYGGKDGMDRVVYEDHNGTSHEVATMDDGMKYSGDSGNAAVKLNKNVQIYGGATEYADGNNIGVVASQDGDDAELQVKLAKDLKGINSIEAKTITTGNTTMDNGGLTVKGDDNHKDIIIHQGNVNMGGNQISGVADGKVSKDSTDAVNGSQLWQRDQAINGLSGSVNKLGNRINRVGAGAAALAALHPLDFDPDDKWDFAAGYGNYRGANAAAIGAYYRPNEDTMFSVGGSFGGGENMVNAGVSIKLGQGNHVSTSRVAMAKEIKDLRQNVANLNAIVNRQSALIDKLTGTNAGMIKDKGNDLFPDVPANHWAYEYVTKLKQAGILTGYPDGNFDGDRMMTRYEFAAIVYRAIMAGAASNPALNQDGTLDKLANEFSSEMKYIRIDTIAKDKNGKPTIERVRVISDAK